MTCSTLTGSRPPCVGSGGYAPSLRSPPAIDSVAFSDRRLCLPDALPSYRTRTQHHRKRLPFQTALLLVRSNRIGLIGCEILRRDSGVNKILRAHRIAMQTT